MNEICCGSYGKIKLGKKDYIDDGLFMQMPIKEMPDSLRARVNNECERGKAAIEDFNTWKETEITELVFGIDYHKEKGLETYILGIFSEVDGDNSGDFMFYLDMPEQKAEVKELLMECLDEYIK